MKKHIKFSKFIISLLLGMLPVFPSPVLSCDNEFSPVIPPTIILPFELANKSLDDLVDSLTFSKVILKGIDNHVQNVGILLNQYPVIVNKMFYANCVSKFIHDSLNYILKDFDVVLKLDSQWPYNNNVNFVMCDISTSVGLLNRLLDNLILRLKLAQQDLNTFDHYRQTVGNTFDKTTLIKELSKDDIMAKIICDKLTDIIKKYNLEKY